ncbi:MAG: outer membrane beta-barrel protein [Bacteroidales bacterium]|nr:outer membrane beta-barrel protein [Bacteroidales bacterium]
MKKNYQIYLKAFAVTLILSLTGVAFGQNTNLDDNDKCYYQWYFNVNGGITQSYCDIQGGEWHGAMLGSDDMDFGFGARLGKHISPVFTLYGSVISAPLKGKSGVDTKNMYFESELLDYILGTTVNFSNLFFGYKDKPMRLTVYGTTGIGFVNFTSQAYNIADDTKVGNGYPSTTETMIPTGIGADFKLSNRWDINLESTIRWFDSDKLDGLISGGKNDAYYFTSLGLSYNFWRPKEKGKIQINTEPVLLALHGDSVPVEVKATVPEYFNSKAVVEFTPILKYGDKTKQLPTIWLQGEDVPEEFRKPGAITIPSTGGSFTYKTNLTYEPGMEVCEIYVDPMASVSNKTPYSLIDRKIADGLIMTSKRVWNNEQFLLADHELQRNLTESQKGVIFFVVNKHDLNFNYQLNKDEKAKMVLKGLNEFIERGWKIKDIDIHAWASPEGEESFNQGLSQRRSESGKKYVEDNYNTYIKKRAKEEKVEVETIRQDLNVKLTAHGEDWDGFMKSVQASDIKDKNIIMNVVNSQSDMAKREQEIRNMTVVYKEIEEDILPPLRRAEITVNCFIPEKSDDEIAQLATTNPGSLSISELLYAATLTSDPNAKMNIYKSATEVHPNEWKGFNNAGYMSMQLGNMNEAREYFTKAKSLASNNGYVLNNTGAIASKEKRYAEAKTNYMEAQKQGVDVNYNMGIIKVLEGNYNGALTSFGSKKCDYNVALAQLLSGNYSGATSTLNCADKNAEVYYLLAVAGARTNNEAQIYENLKKAVTEDPGLKDVAKNDKEFMKYFTSPDFQNAIR